MQRQSRSESEQVFAVKSDTTEMQRRSSMLAILLCDGLIDTGRIEGVNVIQLSQSDQNFRGLRSDRGTECEEVSLKHGDQIFYQAP